MSGKNVHVHTYDEKGVQTCCSLEEKIHSKSKIKNDSHDHDHDHGHDGWKTYAYAGISLILLLSGLFLKHGVAAEFFTGWIEILWYSMAYIPVGLPVLIEAWQGLKSGSIFNEFFLMSIATIGAFIIHEYPEGVAVMLFYAVGELFQSAAVNRAKNNIKALLDIRPQITSAYRSGKYEIVHPDNVNLGETIQIKVGENVPLDGRLISESASINMAALTGESMPVTITKNDSVLAGSINMENVFDMEVTKTFDDSAIARIIELVQVATSRKSKTELLIRRLAKIYTPIVVYAALVILFIPYFIVSDYIFSDWLYRALIFLVISCPCALVISIPLGYFGGLGAASKNGLLFKGATFLDQITKMTTLVMDKTGTVTKGVFKIQEINPQPHIDQKEFMSFLMAVESKSTHPIAKAIVEYNGDRFPMDAIQVDEISGKGIIAQVNGKSIAIGNIKLMEEAGIEIPIDLSTIIESMVLMSIDKKFAGFITLADELKEDAQTIVTKLKEAGIKTIIMLSGDKDDITQSIAKKIGINWAKGNLLPEDKLYEVEQLKNDPLQIVGFVGDGINDAPVLAASDVGIAMGSMGSDVAIETADVIIQTDQPSKIALAIKIGKSTQQIIWQNIGLAFGVKALVLLLGAFGMATMWQAVFADVGVALLAILNAVRLQSMTWK